MTGTARKTPPDPHQDTVDQAPVDPGTGTGTGTDPEAGPSALQLSLDLRITVSRLRRRILQVTDGEDLTPSQASVLMRIGRGGAVTAGALAAVERVRQQSMAVTLSSLQRMGLITRSPDPTDGRRQIIELTEAGRERMAGVRHAGVEWLAHALDEQFDATERRTLEEAVRLLERLTG